MVDWVKVLILKYKIYKKNFNFLKIFQYLSTEPTRCYTSTASDRARIPWLPLTPVFAFSTSTVTISLLCGRSNTAELTLTLSGRKRFYTGFLILPGTPSRHWRVRSWDPSPQVTEHVDQRAQKSHSGHCSRWDVHGITSSVIPSQPASPGLPLWHSRTRICSPSPQVALHWVNSPHALQVGQNCFSDRHTFCSESFPSHPWSPGFPLTHSRDRDTVPRPQVTEQSDQSLHRSQYGHALPVWHWSCLAAGPEQPSSPIWPFLQVLKLCPIMKQYNRISKYL